MESRRSAVLFRLAPALLALLASTALPGLLRSGEGAEPAKPAPSSVATPSTPPKAGSYEQEIANWHRERIEGLKRPEGWLSLVGLFWLKEGENRIGSGADNTVIFPEGSAPAFAGTLERHGKQVTAHAAPGAGLTSDGKPVTDLELQSEPGHVTQLELGSLRFFVIYRGDKVGVRVKDLKSPTLAAFKGIETYPVRPAWRVEARFEPYNPPKPVSVPNILGQVEDTPSPGAVVFEKDGKTYRMDILGQDDKDGSLFFVFGDLTNGHETYGGGRFLDTPGPKDGKVVIDFNRAYNPPCVFTSFATCPLPPKQNKLALRVEAGEKSNGFEHH